MPNLEDRLTVDKLNDDGVVLLICTIFGYYDSYDLAHESGAEKTMSHLFGGRCRIGNSHNGSYQLELNMSRLALHKYQGL